MRLLIALLLIATASGCTRGCRTASPPTPKAEQASKKIEPLKNGSALFGFDYETVTELLIVKLDPATGDHWTAHLSRPDPHSDDWKIVNAGDGPALLDPKADGYFVLHLLDTLRTLRVGQTEVPGPHHSLGLSPPRFALQWRAGSSEYELRIGAKADGGKGVFAWMPGQTAFTVDGATLQMLDYMKTLASLRLSRWPAINADDVDEIVIPPGNANPAGFYAQREGADWNDRGHKSIRADVGSWLEKLAHQRVLSFVDDPQIADSLRSRVQAGPLRQAKLIDRHGRATELSISRFDGKWFALSSARPQGVFEVYPESAQALEAPKRP